MNTKKPLHRHRKKSSNAPGPKPGILKLHGNWKDAVKKSFEKKIRATGWPK